jgi:hypothetical protein
VEQHLTHEFFETVLPRMKESFAEENGSGKVHIDLLLRTGQHLRLEGEPICTAAYISFDKKDGTRHSRIILPYGSIVGVTLIEEGERKVGFTK